MCVRNGVLRLLIGSDAMRVRCHFSRWMLCAWAVLAVAQPARAEIVSFYNSQWDHGSGPQTGWSDGATTGTSTAGGVNVTVTASTHGSATPEPGMYMANVDDAPNFAGFGVGQDSSNANNGSSLLNYVRLDFEFSQAVQIDSFTVTDIDRTSFLGVPGLVGYWDVVAAEGFVDGLGSIGSGVAAEYALSGDTFLDEVNLYGLSAVRADTGGNGQQDPENEAVFNFGSTSVTAFSIYYWNNTPALFGASRQIIGLGDVSFQAASVPEPASLACCLIGLLMLRGTRRLGRRCGTPATSL
jgi:hypothetical protein